MPPDLPRSPTGGAARAGAALLSPRTAPRPALPARAAPAPRRAVQNRLKVKIECPFGASSTSRPTRPALSGRAPPTSSWPAAAALRCACSRPYPSCATTLPTTTGAELLRWLAEAAWLPAALLPSPRIAWTALDDHSARPTLTHAGQTVNCLVHFNERGEIAVCEASRYFNDTGVLPWQGHFSQYRQQRGVFVLFAGEASCVVNGQRQPCAQFVVQELNYEVLQAF